MVFRTDCKRKREEKCRKRSMRLRLEDGKSAENGNDNDHGWCHIPYIHTSHLDFGIQIQSSLILRSTSDPIYDKLPKFISCSFNVITAYSFIW
jgi:hypothetical protein